MIILTIRTDKPVAEIGLFDNEEKIDYEKWEANRQLADTLHEKIRQLLNKNELNWTSIEGVIVYSGPGSFTGLRIGVALASALIYALDCRGIGSGSDTWIENGISRIIKGDSDKTVEINYGAEAHITKPKH